MSVLRPDDRNELLSYAGLRSFVEDPENRATYSTFIEEWRTRNAGDARLLDEDYLSEALKSYLMFYRGDDLEELLRGTLGDQYAARREDFYLFIAMYFVDFTDGQNP